jgi:molybdopterin-guanine dinucleotide biosynthesis protein A/rhodanese-related sulfurtransferase
MTDATTAGAVLCGGLSRRMGTDKAFVEVAGVPMVERVTTALARAGCDPVVLVGGDHVLLARTGREVVADRWPGAGPAGAVVTALEASTAEIVVVASCDLPLLDPAAVGALIGALRADPGLGVAVATTDQPQLSLTAWRRDVAAAPLRERWRRGARSLRELVAAVPSEGVALAPEALRNVNTPDQLSDVEALAGYVGPVPVAEIDVDQLAERLGAGARVVDVREPDEYADGHVPGAVLVPLATVPDHVDAFQGEGPTFVICRTGGRSMRACEFLAAQGLDRLEAVNVAGGTLAWIASGRETIGGDQPS